MNGTETWSLDPPITLVPLPSHPFHVPWSCHFVRPQKEDVKLEGSGVVDQSEIEGAQVLVSSGPHHPYKTRAPLGANTGQAESSEPLRSPTTTLPSLLPPPRPTDPDTWGRGRVRVRNERKTGVTRVRRGYRLPPPVLVVLPLRGTDNLPQGTGESPTHLPD